METFKKVTARKVIVSPNTNLANANNKLLVNQIAIATNGVDFDMIKADSILCDNGVFTLNQIELGKAETQLGNIIKASVSGGGVIW